MSYFLDRQTLGSHRKPERYQDGTKYQLKHRRPTSGRIRNKKDNVMKITRATYNDRDGKTCLTKKWYLDFTDHWNRRHKLAGFTSKSATIELGRKIEDLISYRTAGQSLPRELQIWIDGLPDTIMKNLTSWGLIDRRRVEAGKSLIQHLKDWHEALKAIGTAKNAEMKHSQVSRIFALCGYKNLNDIQASKVQIVISRLKKTVYKGVTVETDELASERTRHHIATSCKQFTRWLVQDGRTSQNPLERMKLPKVIEKQERGAFTAQEIAFLLQATRQAPCIYGLTGTERALLYQLAVETGLRVNELRHLTKDCFIFDDNPVVLIHARETKNSKPAEIPLKRATAQLVQEYLKNKLPGTRVFGSKNLLTTDTANMIRRDMESARKIYLAKTGLNGSKTDFLLEYIGDVQRVFHSLRHTTGTLLSASEVYGGTIKDVMRHASIKTTEQYYIHRIKTKEQQAINSLPDLSNSPEFQAERATGTDYQTVDVIGKKSFDSYFDKKQAEQCNSMQNPAKVAENDQTIKNPVSEPKSAILSQKQGSFIQPPERLELSAIGLQNRSSKNINTDKTKSCETGKKSFDCSLDKKDIFPADLQAIIDRWDSLPEQVRAAILSLAKL